VFLKLCEKFLLFGIKPSWGNYEEKPLQVLKIFGTQLAKGTITGSIALLVLLTILPAPISLIVGIVITGGTLIGWLFIID